MHNIRKLTAALGAACLVGVGLVASAGAASAANTITPTGNPSAEFALVAWQLPDGSWPQDHGQDIYPQTLVGEKFLSYDDVIPNVMGSVNALDGTLRAIPGCHAYQVDLYFNNGGNAALVQQVLADGILNAFEDTSLNLVVHNANKIVTLGAGTTVHHDAVAGNWQNFEPNKNQGPLVGTPSWPTDPRGTWSAPKTNGGPQQDVVGTFQNGNGNGSWFHRIAAVPASDTTTVC